MKFLRQLLTLLLLGAFGAALPAAEPVVPALTTATAAADGKATFQTVCAQCHGPKAEGRIDLRAPSIAGMPGWYMTTQLNNFIKGRRGHDAADPQAFVMAAIVKAMPPERIKAVIAHVEKMPVVVPTGENREVANADPSEGMLLFQERCMQCHRYNASGEMTFGSPPLVGRQAWYLAEQLKRFKSGRRGVDKNDVNGAKMVQMTSLFIENEQMVRDVVAFIMTLNPEPKTAAVEPAAPVIEGSPFESTQTAQR